MEERLPSQIYVVGNFLLLLVVGLALLMMPRAMALDPHVLGSPSTEQLFEEAAELRPLGASGLPELRILSTSNAAALGVVVTPTALERYEFAGSGAEGGRLRLARRVRETTPVAVQVIRSLRELAAFDSHYLVCGAGRGGLHVSGYVDGRSFSFSETGECAGGRSPAIDELLDRVMLDR